MRLFVLLPVFALALLALVPTASTTVHAQENVCQPNPGPVDPADPSIIVSSPAANASVTSPLTVTGEARVFEATVQVALFDSAGNELASTFGTAAAPDVGQHGPFSIDITFTASAQTEACLWVFEQSAETGDPINVVQVPLTLEPAAPAATATSTPGLPSTGAGDGAPASSLVWALAGIAALGAVLAAAGLAARRRRS